MSFGMETHQSIYHLSISIDANLLKKVFRQGEMNTLNVFTVGFPNSTLLGYSTFPWDYRSAPDLDGIIIRHSSFPGGSLIQYSLGKTLVHEAGHWVGLYHTFQVSLGYNVVLRCLTSPREDVLAKETLSMTRLLSAWLILGARRNVIHVLAVAWT
ncbi:hypothetical protein C0993_005437 [Termitomyces sp. T159_Od127]|nr:hypothetical protein C0993_005437 [Termitomyces sp. T159_Od127]